MTAVEAREIANRHGASEEPSAEFFDAVRQLCVRGSRSMDPEPFQLTEKQVQWLVDNGYRIAFVYVFMPWRGKAGDKPVSVSW